MHYALAQLAQHVPAPSMLLGVDNAVWIVAGIVAGLFVLIVLFALGSFLSLWIQAMVSGASVGLFELVFMRLRKVDVRMIVYSRIRAVKSGMDISTNALETHYLAGGRVPNVINAMISAQKAAIELPWDTATAIDLAGRDIVEAVNTSVNPKVIECPNPSTNNRSTFDAVAGDGIQLRAKAKVTVRTNIRRLIGGATEETIIARVGEGIVKEIGSALTHKQVLANPENISKTVMAKGLDAGTAFEILSIDIADIDVGDNIGAKLQTDQANANKQMAQAKAEERRALAIAQEQEFRAEEQKNRAMVVLAEAEIPKAMAQAFASGNLGIMDYYRMKNMQADTSMRQTIAGDTNAPGNARN